ncbi:MAG: hypothetical protein HKN07_07375, partial [Acidimicrobiia bacterium]|nr:hypothetical protein [Acidimicrobiia bacterium]
MKAGSVVLRFEAMSNAPSPSLRFEPDPSVTSATRVPTAPEFAKFDRKAGALVVNRWTYRPLRRLAGLFIPKFDTSGVQITEEPTAGRGMQIVRPDTVTGQGAVLMIHGGGYVLGTNKDILMKAVGLARESGVPVFCPGYRLGP